MDSNKQTNKQTQMVTYVALQTHSTEAPREIEPKIMIRNLRTRGASEMSIWAIEMKPKPAIRAAWGREENDEKECNKKKAKGQNLSSYYYRHPKDRDRSHNAHKEICKSI